MCSNIVWILINSISCLRPSTFYFSIKKDASYLYGKVFTSGEQKKKKGIGNVSKTMVYVEVYTKALIASFLMPPE